jgi:hypothetical protein
MLKNLFLAVLMVSGAQGAFAQSGPPMTGEEMSALTANGVTLQLGGKGMGYTGELVLSADGKGEGSATLDNGNTLSIVGTWVIKDDKFCRTWVDLDEGKEVCEIWYKKSDTSVEVFNGDQMIGLNSW